jgi:hypothetical protein
MTVVIGVQRRFMQLGRVRLGEKGPKGEPKRLNSFRFTSASERLLEHVAAKYGGAVTPWSDAPDEGYYQVTTKATSLDIILPPTFSQEDGTPTTSYSQWYELWSKGGCQRRCDGVTESLSGQPCQCDPFVRDAGTDPGGTCGIITRVSFIIPDLPGLGVWRLDSGGWNAAVELPGTLSLLADAAAEQRFIPAVLSLQNRTKKVGGQTRRFVVPVIDLPDVTIGQLVNGTAPTYALNAPGPVDKAKPALPPAPAPPDDPAFEHGDDIPFGAPPALPKAPEPTPLHTEADTLKGTLIDIATKRGSNLTKVHLAIADNLAAQPLAAHVAWLREQLEKVSAA